MIDRYTVERINAIPILEVAKGLQLKVIHKFCLCPFHEDKNASLHFNTKTNRYHCYACDERGGNIDLVMKVERLGFRDAVKWLSDGSNMIVEDEDSNRSNKSDAPRGFSIDVSALSQMVADRVLTKEAKAFLFGERHLDPRVIEWCGISSTHTHLLIPYFGLDGALMSVQWRYLGRYANPQIPDEPRFKFPSGACSGIYNMQILRMLKPGESLYITEGCSDCWAMLSAGHKAIAIPSATTLIHSQLKVLAETLVRLGTQSFMYPDADGPGERLFSELQNQLSKSSLSLTRLQLPAGCKDFSDFWVSQGDQRLAWGESRGPESCLG